MQILTQVAIGLLLTNGSVQLPTLPIRVGGSAITVADNWRSRGTGGSEHALSRQDDGAQATRSSNGAEDWWGDALDALLAEVPPEQMARLPKDMAATIDKNLYDI